MKNSNSVVRIKRTINFAFSPFFLIFVVFIPRHFKLGNFGLFRSTVMYKNNFQKPHFTMIFASFAVILDLTYIKVCAETICSGNKKGITFDRT